jgi:hypothetical protein
MKKSLSCVLKIFDYFQSIYRGNVHNYYPNFQPAPNREGRKNERRKEREINMRELLKGDG